MNTRSRNGRPADACSTSQELQRLRLNLPYPFACKAEPPGDVLERVLVTVDDTVSQFEDRALALVERVEGPFHEAQRLFLEQRSIRGMCVGVGQDITEDGIL